MVESIEILSLHETKSNHRRFVQSSADFSLRKSRQPQTEVCATTLDQCANLMWSDLDRHGLPARATLHKSMARDGTALRISTDDA